jgi:uncharacterized membrane protein YuzA (DUF378 family)
VKKFARVTGIILLAGGLCLFSGWLNASLIVALAAALRREAGQNWPLYLKMGGFLGVAAGAGLVFWHPISAGWERLQAAQREVLGRWDSTLKDRWGKVMDFSERSMLLPRFNRWDAVILLVFVGFSVFYQIARMSTGFPNVLLSSDAANLAGFAAASQYPQLFQNDLILNNPANFRLYSTIHIPLLRLLETFCGNFGLAFSLLLGPHVFLQLFGFYWLGRIFLRSRYWGIIFSLMAAAPVPLPLGEVWGVVKDALPRFTFQVLLVFLLGLVFLWRSNPRRWLWIMAAAGLLAFVHPVSAPVWGVTLLIGFWPVMPDNWSLRKRLEYLFILGLTFLVALLPYMLIYLSAHQGGSGSTDYDLLYKIITEYFPDNIYDMQAALTVFLGMLNANGLLWFGLAGLVFSFFYLPGERKNLSQIAFWLVGLTMVAIILPWGEQIIEKQFRIIPLQTELVRGIRYFVPLLIMLWVLPLAGLARRLKNPILIRGLMALGVLSVIFWFAINPFQPTSELQNTLSCFTRGQIICPLKEDFAQTLEAARTITPQQSTFAVMRKDWNNGTELRYLALRPLVYAFKDKGFLVYSNHTVLRRWDELFLLEKEIYRKSTTPDEQRSMAVAFARESGANYLLTDFPYTPAEISNFGLDLSYQNGEFMILKINPQ